MSKYIKKYLSPEDIKYYMRLSIKLKKTVIVTDPAGSGKTTATRYHIKDNHEKGIMYSAQAIPTINNTKGKLIDLGINKDKIESYHSEYPMKMMTVYEKKALSPISLITHDRMNRDHHSIFYHSINFRCISNTKLPIIIDEKPSLEKSYDISINGIFSLIEKIDKSHSLIKLMHCAINNRKFLSDKKVLSVINSIQIDLRYSISKFIHTLYEEASMFDSNRMQKQLTIIKNSILYQDKDTLLPIELIKTTNICTLQLRRYSHRLYYLLIKTIYSILNGRFTLEGLIANCCFSPIIFWRYPVVILDASGEKNPYPPEFCHIHDQRVRRSGIVRIVPYNCTNNYNKMKKRKSKRNESIRCITAICNTENIGPIYITSRKGEPKSKDSHTTIMKIGSDLHTTEEKVEIEGQNIRNLIQEDLQGQDIVSEILKGPGNVLDISAKNGNVISYYGLLKGSNEFKYCTSVILQTSYYKNRETIRALAMLHKKSHDDEFERKINRDWSVADRYQEFMRAAIRKEEETWLFYPFDIRDREQLTEFDEFVSYLQFKGLEVIREENFQVSQLEIITPIMTTINGFTVGLTDKQKNLVIGLMKSKNISGEKLRHDGLHFTSHEARELMDNTRQDNNALKRMIKSINNRSQKLVIKELELMKNMQKGVIHYLMHLR